MRLFRSAAMSLALAVVVFASVSLVPVAAAPCAGPTFSGGKETVTFCFTGAAQRDTGYIHDYGSGKVLTFHVSRIVGQVRYNDGTWLHYQANRPTLTLQTCMDWKPTGNRYIVQLT